MEEIAQRMRERKGILASSMLFLGYAFLYLPIILVIFYSLNKAATISWQGFSLRWYKMLFSDRAILSAAWVSLRVALCSATISVVLGTACAYAITRSPRRVLQSMSTAPLVVPEIVMGLSMLLFFVVSQRLFGWPQRGMLTIIIAHTTLGTAYVVMIVRARLTNFDKRLEEAALNLGARPRNVFFLVTLPLIFPSIVSGWLISFILSLDDVILASFTSGPGASTLPLVIFSSLRFGSTPEINALASCIVFLASALIVSAECVTRWRKLL